MIKKGFFYFFVALSLFHPVWGYNLDQVLQELKSKDKIMNSLRFNFIQEINFTGSDVQSSVEGEVLLQKPKKIKVQQKKPQEQLTISNGQKLWIYTPSLKQVWVVSAKDWVHGDLFPKGMLPFQNYISDLILYFNLSLIENSDQSKPNEIHLSAVPKEKKIDYTLELVLSSESWLPIKTIFHSSSATVMTSLSQVVVNPPVPEQAFQFTPPPGTDVIPLN